MKKILIFLVCFSIYCFSHTYAQKKFIDSIYPKEFYTQYEYLIQKSFLFVYKKNNAAFFDSVNYFLKKNVEYTLSDESYNEDVEPIICHPIFFNQNMDEAIIIILKRLPLEQRIDYINFVTAKRKNKKSWTFKLNRKPFTSFTYYKFEPRPTDTEITLKIVKAIIDDGYFFKNTVEVNDSFFTANNSLYIFNF